MEKKNCWEFHECGREEGGSRIKEKGICPVANANKLNNSNGGTNAGRACWVVAGTYCGGKTSGDYVNKILDCIKCDFYKEVRIEEGANYLKTQELVKVLNT